MAGVYRQHLSSLVENSQNTLIIGVIISSTNPRTLEVNYGYHSGVRCVWTFTLRDSERDTINVTVWGSVDFVKGLAAVCHIGSVVDVINAKVVVRKANDSNDAYNPTVTSPYTLTVNERAAIVQFHDGADQSDFTRLLPLPIKSLSNLRSLKSIMDNIDGLVGQFVDIVLIVTCIGEAKSITTKDGRSVRTRDFEATDGSYNGSIAFKLWENEWVLRSENWQPTNTIILLTDAQITYNSFKRANALTITRKTIITENPSVPQAAELKNSIRSDATQPSHESSIIPRPENITNVMTIREITEKLNRNVNENTERIQFTTLLYAEVTDINLESNTSPVVTRCALCKRIVQNHEDSCMNLNCACGNGRSSPQNIDQFYLKVNLKDNTGYLIGCSLIGDTAEAALNCTAGQFKAMTVEQRVQLKAKFLLQRYDIRLHVLGPSLTFKRALYKILSITTLNDRQFGEDFTVDFQY